MRKAKIIQFPKPTPKKRVQKVQRDFPYFTEQQIRLLRRTVKDAARLAELKGQVTAIREWMLIDLLTSSGLREAEAVALRCGDITKSAIYVRNGKGSKARTVQIPDSLGKHLKAFIKWKAGRGEPTDRDAYIFTGQRGTWKTSAVQQVVKKWLRKLNLYQPGKSAHALRHSYAVFLYRKES